MNTDFLPMGGQNTLNIRFKYKISGQQQIIRERHICVCVCVSFFHFYMSTRYLCTVCVFSTEFVQMRQRQKQQQQLLPMSCSTNTTTTITPIITVVFYSMLATMKIRSHVCCVYRFWLKTYPECRSHKLNSVCFIGFYRK